MSGVLLTLYIVIRFPVVTAGINMRPVNETESKNVSSKHYFKRFTLS